MKPAILFLPLLLLATFQSCKKDKPVPGPEPALQSSTASSSYMPLAVGNYWIYQKSMEDSAGNFTFNNSYDSVYVSKDTSYNGKRYYTIEHSNPSFYTWPSTPQHLYDSSGYIYDASGDPYFDPVHINDTVKTYYQSWSGNYYLVPRLYPGMATPCGNYNGVMMTVNYPNIVANPVFFSYQAYAQGVGAVRVRVSFFSSPWPAQVAQLVRYHLN